MCTQKKSDLIEKNYITIQGIQVIYRNKRVKVKVINSYKFDINLFKSVTPESFELKLLSIFLKSKINWHESNFFKVTDLIKYHFAFEKSTFD